VLSALQDSTVRVVTHDRNRGKGAAVRTGLGSAKGDLLIIQDADLEYDPEDWPRLLDPVLKGKAQVVYGSRFTGERKNMLPSHWVGNRFLALMTNLLYRSTLSDMETCYKLFDCRVLDGMTIDSDRFEFEPEITAKVLRRGYRIYEVPVSYAGRERSEGKKISWHDGIGALVTLLRYRLSRHI
jgi:glycosyltransferase involved in cell wall biosynthesis